MVDSGPYSDSQANQRVAPWYHHTTAKKHIDIKPMEVTKWGMVDSGPNSDSQANQRVVPWHRHTTAKKHIGIKPMCFFGGGWWIRTTEVSDNRFTVCPLWPLGKSPIWSWWSESNQQPADYKSAALPLSHTSICRRLLRRLWYYITDDLFWQHLFQKKSKKFCKKFSPSKTRK